LQQNRHFSDMPERSDEVRSWHEPDQPGQSDDVR
jgi:hypothetical protein